MIQLLLPLLGSVLEKVLPDPQTAADAKLKLLDLAQKGELAVLDAETKIAMGQIEVNKQEAASPDLFRGGWRPSVGWICVFGLGYQFLIQPLLPWIISVINISFGHSIPNIPELPKIDNESLMILLTGMLGLGGFRTFERIKGKV